MDRNTRIILALALMLASSVRLARSQDLASFEKRVTVKTLANGLTVVVCERPEAPVFSFFTHVDVGSDREVPGITGLAHMFEHEAFKGTDKIGTNNYAEEKVALDNEEKAYLAYDHERRKEVGRDEKKVADLEKAWKDAMVGAQKYVETNEFGRIVEEHGGQGLNAFTSNEETGYFYSFPSNQVELWAYLESERFLHPVLREFYKEREVVHEERRLSESQQFGRLLEQFAATAYVAHPYGQPVVGWPSDLESFSRTDAEAYYSKYYVPANMVVTVVGDVKASEVLPVVDKYFGRLPARPKPDPLRTIEPQQNSERIVILHETSQPIFIEGYHKPSARDKDEAVYSALEDLMSNGRTSRLYRSLVRDKKIAANSAGFNNYPGSKYPSLFVFYAISTPGHTPQEIRDAIHAEIDRVKKEDISDDELQMIKTRAKANLIRNLGSDEGLAFQLGSAQSLYGDWREVFHHVDKIGQVSKADIRRVANATFVDSNRTIAMIESTQLAQGARWRGDKVMKRLHRTSIVFATALSLLALPPQSHSQATDWKQVQAPPLRRFEPAMPKRVQLANGLVFFLLEDHELPLIRLGVAFHGGSVSQPRDKVGLVRIFGEVWRTGGTKNKTGDQLDDYLEARAATVETNGWRDATSVNLDCLKDNFDDVSKSFWKSCANLNFARTRSRLQRTGSTRRFRGAMTTPSRSPAARPPNSFMAPTLLTRNRQNMRQSPR